MALGKRHHARVGEAEVEIGEAGVELDRPPHEAGREERHLVLAGAECLEEQPRGVRADSRAKQLVDLDDHRAGDDQLATDPRHELRRERVCAVAAVRRGDERPGVGDDPQRAVTSLDR